MKNVIITGADGFVGSYTVKHFLNEGETVLAFDMDPSARRLEEHPNLKYMQCDISDTKAMLDGIEKGGMTLLFISHGQVLLEIFVSTTNSKCRMQSILLSA